MRSLASSGLSACLLLLVMACGRSDLEGIGPVLTVGDAGGFAPVYDGSGGSKASAGSGGLASGGVAGSAVGPGGGGYAGGPTPGGGYAGSAAGPGAGGYAGDPFGGAGYAGSAAGPGAGGYAGSAAGPGAGGFAGSAAGPGAGGMAGGPGTGGFAGKGGAGGFAGKGGAGGSAGKGGSAGGPPCGYPITQYPPCDSCLGQACCGDVSACVQDKGCNALMNCLVTCSDQFCQEQCFQQYPQGQMVFEPLAGCINNSCVDACSGGTGGGPGNCGGLQADPPECDACFKGSCCAQGQKCADVPSCFDFLYCIDACGGDEPCMQDCANKNPEGYNVYYELMQCLIDKCQVQCTGGGGGPVCGNGQIEPGEECDDGGSGNFDSWGLALYQHGGLLAVTKPYDIAIPADAFYNYYSASSHTGFEQPQTSVLIVHRDITTGLVSLVVHHGIDEGGGGPGGGPEGQVQMFFKGLPPMAGVTLSDDNNELSMQGPGAAFGDWKFSPKNSDGGVIEGMLLPSDFDIEISPTFISGVNQWLFVGEQGTTFYLDPQAPVRISARSWAPACRANCTKPRCGDYLLDGGEVCDDGNQSPGDGCSPDCKALQ